MKIAYFSFEFSKPRGEAEQIQGFVPCAEFHKRAQVSCNKNLRGWHVASPFMAFIESNYYRKALKGIQFHSSWTELSAHTAYN